MIEITKVGDKNRTFVMESSTNGGMTRQEFEEQERIRFMLSYPPSKQQIDYMQDYLEQFGMKDEKSKN